MFIFIYLHLDKKKRFKTLIFQLLLKFAVLKFKHVVNMCNM